MHRIFSGNGWLAFLGIRKSARDHRPSQLPVQQRLVLVILSILSIHAFLIYIDAQDAQDFSGNGWLAFLGIRKSARDHRRSQLLVQQRLVLVILSILSIHAFLINIDAQDAQDFFRKRLACIPEHPQTRTGSSRRSASRAAASRPGYPVHPVHRCSIFGPSRLICPVAFARCAQNSDAAFSFGAAHE